MNILIERACRGDRDAKGEVFAAMSDRLRLYVDFRLGSALRRQVEVDDVVQETFLRANADLDGREFSGESALFRYLTRIARNAIADVARAARTARRDGAVGPLRPDSWSRSGDGNLPPSSVTGPLTRAVRGEKQRLLAKAFEELTPRHRRVIALRQFEQLPAKEIAAKVGCETEGAVHALYRRALDAWGAAIESLGARSKPG